MKKKGFGFYVSKEKILKTLHLTPEEKLRWLEEANRFIEIALPKEKRQLWERYRKGEI